MLHLMVKKALPKIRGFWVTQIQTSGSNDIFPAETEGETERVLN